MNPPSENIYGHRKRFDWFVGMLARHRPGDPRGTRVLDIGCGTGVMVTIPLGSRGYDITGIDDHRESIERAQKINPFSNVKFICGGMEKLRGKYDVIILSEVLEHIPDHTGFIASLSPLLAEGGIILCSVPNGYGWFEFEQFLWDRLKIGVVLEKLGLVDAIFRFKKKLLGIPYESVPSTLSSSPHVQRFTLCGLRRDFENMGFTVVEREGSTLVSGKFSNLLLTGLSLPMKLNNALGSMLPGAACGFYFVLKMVK